MMIALAVVLWGLAWIALAFAGVAIFAWLSPLLGVAGAAAMTAAIFLVLVAIGGLWLAYRLAQAKRSALVTLAGRAPPPRCSASPHGGRCWRSASAARWPHSSLVSSRRVSKAPMAASAKSRAAGRNDSSVWSIAVWIVAAAAALFILDFASAILLPTAYACILALLLAPIARGFSRLIGDGLRRSSPC
jgi:hypothetical protein